MRLTPSEAKRPAEHETYKMGEIVNLNKVRKQRRRQAHGATALENRARHGRTKATLAKLDQQARRDRDAVEDKRLDDRPKQGPRGE